GGGEGAGPGRAVSGVRSIFRGGRRPSRGRGGGGAGRGGGGGGGGGLRVGRGGRVEEMWGEKSAGKRGGG
ncbi:hypothetical protein DXF87_26055, partial [Enterobacter roggenkampii]